MRIAVGGNRRKAGKTSVICSLIRALPEANWIAIKISPHAHEPSPEGDTGRFLKAGARSALLLSAPPDAWPAGNVFIESSAVRDADLYLLVIDADAGEFKESAHALLERADALVVTGGGWDDPGRPVFHAPPPDYADGALVEYVRRLLRGSKSE